MVKHEKKETRLVCKSHYLHSCTGATVWFCLIGNCLSTPLLLVRLLFLKNKNCFVSLRLSKLREWESRSGAGQAGCCWCRADLVSRTRRQAETCSTLTLTQLLCTVHGSVGTSSHLLPMTALAGCTQPANIITG